MPGRPLNVDTRCQFLNAAREHSEDPFETSAWSGQLDNSSANTTKRPCSAARVVRQSWAAPAVFEFSLSEEEEDAFSGIFEGAKAAGAIFIE